MSVTTTLTINEILNRVAIEVGLDAVTDPFASQEQHFVQMRGLLQISGEELCMAHDWEFMVKTFQITVAGGDDGEYDLPEDFQSFIDQTGWNNTTQEPLIGPLTAQEWEAVQGRDEQNLIRYGFRIFGGNFNIYPDPPAEGMDLSLEYQGFHFVESGTTPGTFKGTFDNAADKILFDRTLITRYLKLKWLGAKGFDTSAAQNDMNQTFSFLTGKDKGGKVLDIGGGNSGFRLLNGGNLPITGYGV